MPKSYAVMPAVTDVQTGEPEVEGYLWLYSSRLAWATRAHVPTNQPIKQGSRSMLGRCSAATRHPHTGFSTAFYSRSAIWF